MVLLAFSLQDQVEKYGTYVGIAAFFGLAVLTLLYFAQAREVKRLREWAGRAPERAAELEQAVHEHAEEVAASGHAGARAAAGRRAQQLSQSAPATNGAVKLKPAEVAALAFARSAGVHEPHEPKPHPAPARGRRRRRTEVAAADGRRRDRRARRRARPSTAAAPAIRRVPKPATPAARRVEQPPPPAAAARVASPPPPAGRRTTTAPPPRETNTRAVVITAVIGVLVLAGAVFGITRLAGGGEDPAPPANVVATPTPEDSADGGDDEPATTATPRAERDQGERARRRLQRHRRRPGWPPSRRELLRAEGYPSDNLGTGDSRPTSGRPRSCCTRAARKTRAAGRRRRRSASPRSSSWPTIQPRAGAGREVADRSGTWSQSSAPTSRTSPVRAMPLVARVTFLVLVGATFSAFFVAQRLKSSRPVIDVKRPRDATSRPTATASATTTTSRSC